MAPTTVLYTPSLLTVVVVGLAVLTGTDRAGATCTESLFDDVLTCFTSQGLQLAVDSGQQDATKLIYEAQAMDPSVQCQRKEQYKAAITCALMSLKKCLVTVGMAGAIPDPTRVEQGMDVVCDRQQDIDGECLKTHYHEILMCGEDTVKNIVRENSQNMNIDDIICISADVNYDCARKHMKSCDQDTLDIYLEQLDKYQVPAACVNRSPGRSGRQRYTSDSSGSSHDVTNNSVTVSLTVLAAVASLGLHTLFL